MIIDVQIHTHQTDNGCANCTLHRSILLVTCNTPCCTAIVVRREPRRKLSTGMSEVGKILTSDRIFVTKVAFHCYYIVVVEDTLVSAYDIYFVDARQPSERE